MFLKRSIYFVALCALGCGSDGITGYTGPFLVPQTQPTQAPAPPPPIPVTTIAGAGDAGDVDAQGTNARFNNPANLETDPSGNLYVADFDNNTLRKIDGQGNVTTLVRQNTFQRPFGVTFGQDNQVYVETDGNDLGQRDGTTGTIWRVNPTSGAATVVARNLGRPRGLCVTQDGRIVLSNLTRSVVELMNPSNGAITFLAGTEGVSGFANANGNLASFSRPYGPAIAPNGDILLADQDNNRIRRVTLAGEVSTFAGTGAVGSTNGPRLNATFDHPQDVVVDGAGNVYVSDNNNHLLRKIDTLGDVSTFAGTGVAGFADGQLLQAQFFGQEGFCLAHDGSALYVADGTGGGADPFNRIRKVLFP